MARLTAELVRLRAEDIRRVRDKATTEPWADHGWRMALLCQADENEKRLYRDILESFVSLDPPAPFELRDLIWAAGLGKR